MKRKLAQIIVAIVVLFVSAGCPVHEYPTWTEDGELGVDPTKVSLTAEINLDLTLPGTIENTLPGEGYVHRFIVEIFSPDNFIQQRKIIYNDDISSTSIKEQLRVPLHAREYSIIVWCDYVKAADRKADLFYDTADLSIVSIKEEYTANDNARDTFYGGAVLDLRPYAEAKLAKVNIGITLSRTGGRYELVATDTDSFRQRCADGSIPGSKFRMRVTYSEPLAMGYNCIEGLRKNILSNISYEVELPRPEELVGYETLLCFDYCFCSPDESLSIPLSVEIVNENNEVVATNNIYLPIYNGINTTVKERFLTALITGGVGIDPSLDGTINIDLGTLSTSISSSRQN